MKVVDVKDIKILKKPNEVVMEEENEEEGKQKKRRFSRVLELPSNNVRTIMCMPSVLAIQLFNLILSVAFFFVFMENAGPQALSRKHVIFGLRLTALYFPCFFIFASGFRPCIFRDCTIPGPSSAGLWYCLYYSPNRLTITLSGKQ